MNTYNSPLGESRTHNLGCSLGCLLTEADSIIYKEGKVYMPKDEKLRAEIIRLHHDIPIGGHGGQ